MYITFIIDKNRKTFRNDNEIYLQLINIMNN